MDKRDGEDRKCLMIIMLTAESRRAEAPSAFLPVTQIHSCHQKCPWDNKAILQDPEAVPM